LGALLAEGRDELRGDGGRQGLFCSRTAKLVTTNFVTRKFVTAKLLTAREEGGGPTAEYGSPITDHKLAVIPVKTGIQAQSHRFTEGARAGLSRTVKQ